jgi:mono/diheme cytochrome c family protein
MNAAEVSAPRSCATSDGVVSARAALLAFAIALAAPLGCAQESPAPDPGGSPPAHVERLTLRSVGWNASGQDVGSVVAIADDRRRSLLFGTRGVTIVDGAKTTRVTGPTSWIGAAVLPGPDGTPWSLAIDGDGRLHRVANDGTLVSVGARFGLDRAPLRSLARVDAKTAAFGLDGEIVVVDASTVHRYAGPANGRIVAGGGTLAWLESDAVHTCTADGRSHRIFALEGARAIAVDDGGGVVAITRRVLYREYRERDGALTHVWTSDVDLDALAATATGVYLAGASELTFVGNQGVMRTAGAAIGSDVALIPTDDGALWVTGAPPRKLALGAKSTQETWTEEIAPIFARACAGCHGQGAAIDLSTPAAWSDRAASLETRVVTERSMPPAPASFADDDREVIARWLASLRTEDPG